jgi:hypothetical protein
MKFVDKRSNPVFFMFFRVLLGNNFNDQFNWQNQF